MNILEAIQGAGENWFRPVEFRKSGEAYFIAAGNTWITTKNMKAPEMNSRIEFLTGEWEIVTPEQVLSERKL